MKTIRRLLGGLGLALFSVIGMAQGVVPHAEGLREELITVELSGNRKQSGVYSTRRNAAQATRLAVLLPGYPSVVRPVVENGVMSNSRLTGNFLIRARRFLADDLIAALIVDCHSESGDYCSSGYQSSKQRQEDVDLLIAEVRKRAPSIAEVWLVGTSMGTISSSFMPLHNPQGYAGAIHTAAVTEPLARNSYRELHNFDYRKSETPQFFIHHINDPCVITSYAGAKKIAEAQNLTLITVSGGSGFQGPPCQAFTEHGFRGKEVDVMRAIGTLIKSGRPADLDIK